MVQKSLKEEIFSISNPSQFEALALRIFIFQYENNKIYREFCDYLGQTPKKVTRMEKIPFLPIQFYKSKAILSSTKSVETVFTSSGTSGAQTSKHYVTDSSLYQKSFRKGFSHFYGDIKEYTVLALLPSYLERKGSSLIFMVQDFIKESQSPDSGFYLNDFESLSKKLVKLDKEGEKILLIGVSFALLELAEKYTFNLENTLVMETGGMKGRRKELVRQELHEILKSSFGVKNIHSEYGMTELLSQAYSKGQGRFETPPWFRFFARDPEENTKLLPPGQTGGINCVDLANINSCSFIATQDLGKVGKDGKIEILGRFDHSDVRGCNLMMM